MNNDLYIELTNKIKNLQPKISDSQILTANIMHNVERLKHKNKYYRILTVTSWSSSIAASLLIALFLFEQFLPQNNTKIENPQILSISTTTVYSIDINSEKTATFYDFNQFLRIKKERQQKHRRSYSYIIDKHQNL
ncbi:MAG: hypothetical protein LBI45_00565 [Bacteroidales bacterium]|jgi:hypothetical protein|nr:hypothetical protein [Bacteroidales bacterium]